jgi:uncharacterized SAM-binding protein YcdF (DUF218 family)
MYALVSNLLDPLLLLLTLIAAGLAWLWVREPQARRRLAGVIAPFVLLWLACTPAVMYLAAGALEWRFPPVTDMPEAADCIIVLSGDVLTPSRFIPETRPGDATRRRCIMAARLYHQRPTPVLVSGGKVDPTQPGDSLAAAMQQTLIAMGVAESDIVLEDRSSDTFENAAHCRATLAERGLKHAALVSDATHLYRATRCFRRQGVEVTPVAAHYEISSFRANVADFLPRTSGAVTCARVFHEVVGLAWFALRGRL